MALKLNPAPTFKATVKLPVPGGSTEDVEFEFKHRTVDALDALFKPETAKDRGDVDLLMDMAAGWNIEDAPFSRDAMAQLVQNYHAAPRVVTETYLRELTQARLGN